MSENPGKCAQIAFCTRTFCEQMSIVLCIRSWKCEVPLGPVAHTWPWGPRSWCRKCLTAWLVKSDWCLQPSQLLRRDEGKQVMQIGLEAACWHLTSGMVIKNTLWQRQHLVVHSKRQLNSSVVLHYSGRTCTEDERCAAKLQAPFQTMKNEKQNKFRIKIKFSPLDDALSWKHWPSN